MNDMYLSAAVQAGLLWYFVLLAVMNFCFAGYLFACASRAAAAVWCVVAGRRAHARLRLFPPRQLDPALSACAKKSIR